VKGKFAVQLYTLRDELQRDFPGTLRKLKKMGWSGVQIGALYQNKAEDIAGLMKELGLRTAGLHVGLDRLRNDLDNVLMEAEVFDTKDLILPYLGENMRTVESYIAVRRFLNDIAAKLKEQGYRISYHNHDFEFFTEIEGKTALEYLLDPSGENEVLAEIDVYWVKKAGWNPLSFIRNYAHRMPIIHLKDMTNDGNQSFAEVGTGLIDFEPILKWGEENGIEWYVVEQDVCPGNPMDSLKISLDNLNKLADRLGPN
jgi:sugar phosphate isomerase/epimerase